MLEYLPLDMFQHIFEHLSQHELLNILLTNKLIYSQIMKYINTTKFICIDSDNKLGNGCENNLIISIKQTKSELDWHLGLYYACFGGYINIVKLMIYKGVYKWNGGLYSACRGGHESIVKLMIDKGAYNVDLALIVACERGYTNIVKLMIEKGATQCFCNKSISEHIKNE